jgi:hypothetical protein
MKPSGEETNIQALFGERVRPHTTNLACVYGAFLDVDVSDLDGERREGQRRDSHSNGMLFTKSEEKLQNFAAMDRWQSIYTPTTMKSQ